MNNIETKDKKPKYVYLDKWLIVKQRIIDKFKEHEISIKDHDDRITKLFAMEKKVTKHLIIVNRLIGLVLTLDIALVIFLIVTWYK